MAGLKTKKQNGGVKEFLAEITDEQTRKDCQTIVDLMTRVTNEQPDMWGASMVGFGNYRYKYASGRQGDWFPIGFSPRKQNLTLYMSCGWEYQDMRDLPDKLGPHSLGKGCLYIKRLSDVDMKVLESLARRAYQAKDRYLGAV